MLRVFCFGTLAVTVEDVYLLDPDPQNPEHERGVRLELRLVEPRPWRGTRSASQPVVVDQAIWRCDFLETVRGGPGTKDRMHHHPGMQDNEPGRRVFDEDLTGDPMSFLQRQLTDVTPLLEAAKIPVSEEHRESARALHENLTEVVDTVTTVLSEVRAGTLATTPTR